MIAKSVKSHIRKSINKILACVGSGVINHFSDGVLTSLKFKFIRFTGTLEVWDRGANFEYWKNLIDFFKFPTPRSLS